MTGSNFFHAHTHSEFSPLDAISSVDSLVEKAKKMGQPAMALTDHGNMSGTVQLYKAGQKHGLQVFPGLEGYLCADTIDGEDKQNGKLPRYHIGFLSLDYDGYKALAQFNSLHHTRPRFNRFPRFDLNDLAEFSEKTGSVAITTGCFFGLVQQTLVHKGEKPAQRIVEMYSRWFPGRVFVELQNHNIIHSEQDDTIPANGYETDADICDALFGIAARVGVPVIITQDSHYCDSRDREAHQLMKRMVYRGDNEAANEFPGDSFHLATTQWVEEHHDPQHWAAAEMGYKELLAAHDLELPALDKYHAHVPSTKKNPHRWLERKCWAALDALEQDSRLVKKREAYDKRLKHELDIIEYLGHAGYFTLVHEYVAWCEKEGICIEARGSANGSLVCYLLGITQVDPLQWNLLFERFLSRDRKKPPDIDMDIEDVRRDDLVQFLRDKFSVEQIGTYGALGGRDDDKGSVLVSYNSYLRSKLGNDKFIPRFGRGIETISDVKSYNKRDYRGLRLLEKSKVKRSYGVHAAGLLLSGDTQKIEDYVPTMLVASSGTTVTQFTMDDVEELGYLKLDILGQRTLTIMRRAQELIGRENPRDFSWIPLNDKETCRVLSKGQMDNGIFQFEGYAMARGARALKIRNTMDCVLAGALFRPACIESGMTDLYIRRRFNPEMRQDIDYPHPAFEEVLKPTYGVVLFQEQVLEIMRRLGLDYEGINTFFKIVKDSGKGATERNKDRLAEVEKQWQGICERNGIEDPDEAWRYIEGYTQYGFNKAHSTGYGLRSYRVAYLKTHYPLEFMTALLECNSGRMKEPTYIKEARNMGIRLMPPDVNVSGPVWTLDARRGAIRKGLSSIKGVGENAAKDIAENAPYQSLDEMVAKCKPRSVSGAPRWKKEGVFTGVLLALKNAGALVSLGIGKDD